MSDVWLNVIHAPGQADRCIEAVFYTKNEYDGVRLSEWSACPRDTAIVIDKHMNVFAWSLNEDSS